MVTPVLIPLTHCTHAPACHCLPLVSPKHSNDRENESGALNSTEYFSQETQYLHDKMIDAPPGHCPDEIHGSENRMQ